MIDTSTFYGEAALGAGGSFLKTEICSPSTLKTVGKNLDACHASAALGAPSEELAHRATTDFATRHSVVIANSGYRAPGEPAVSRRDPDGHSPS